MTDEMKELKRRLGDISAEMLEKGQYEKNRGLIIAMFTLDSLVQRNDRENMAVIPKPIADYIEDIRSFGVNVYEAVSCACSLAKNGDDNEHKLGLWVKNNVDDFARAWLDGYKVEAQHDTRTD